ncbi:MAG TPA: hypothetical protein VJT32_09195 [bacterium]|nr:hypothetical protein [bacterium]
MSGTAADYYFAACGIWALLVVILLSFNGPGSRVRPMAERMAIWGAFALLLAGVALGLLGSMP